MMRRILCGVVAMLALAPSTLWAANPGITLIGKGLIAGTSLDKSGLKGDICDAANPASCIPQATLGGFGSDLAYTGHDDVFIAAPDRGPFNGLTDVPYIDRVHFLHITTELGAAFPNIHLTLLDTRLLKNEAGQTFVGAAGAFANNDFATLRLDPEGIRVGFNGDFYISDEYGPYLFEFDRQGHLVRRISVLSKF